MTKKSNKLILTLTLVALLILSTLIVATINIKSTPENEKTAFEKIFGRDDSSQETPTNKEKDITQLKTDDSSLGSGGSSGGSGTSSSSEEGADQNQQEPLICESKQIHYSLKNFNKDIVCLENSAGRCTTLSSICSVQVHNIDTNSLEKFQIKYYIEDSSKNELNSTIIERIVNVNEPQTFEVFFINMDLSGIDIETNCQIEIQQIPTKEVCY